MSLSGSNKIREGSNCLLIFKNKKIISFEGADGLIAAFAGAGYYFDKISYIAYDCPDSIVGALKEAKCNYENLVIFCPSQMENALKNYLEGLYSEKFNEFGILKCEKLNVFLLFYDTGFTHRFRDIKKLLDEKYGVHYDRDYIKTVGAPSAKINSAIESAKNICADIDFNVSDSYGLCSIEIIYSSKVSKVDHDKVMRAVTEPLKEYVYALEDISLADRLYQLLKLRRMKISVAESFTGGGVGKKLVEVSGISEVYFEGLNTYSNEAKVRRLGVSEFTLHQYGAVSEETAREMAAGLIKSGNCDISIATTGIAGPKSDNTSKPVGLAYIAIGTNEKVWVYKYNFKGNRETVTNTAINFALFLAYKTLK